ncbi:MAG: hypothetical protein IT347_04115 [Candidatus Eisenbacteria bacterium]|nr:hypothetical protein [Candidatus Eisenbacteria bacterium]
MRADFAKILYVVAHDNVQGRKSDVRGPQAGHGLTKRQISEELSRHFGAKESPDREVIDDACAVFLRQNYFGLKGGKSGKRYLLHEDYTAPTLILDRTDARIVLAISELADMDDQFPLEHAVRVCSGKVSLPEDEVLKRIDLRSKPINDIKGYFQETTTGAYELNSKTVEEERPYLELVSELGFRTPKATLPSTKKGDSAGRRTSSAKNAKKRTAKKARVGRKG